jgi:hypothetical protein
LLTCTHTAVTSSVSATDILCTYFSVIIYQLSYLRARVNFHTHISFKDRYSKFVLFFKFKNVNLKYIDVIFSYFRNTLNCYFLCRFKVWLFATFSKPLYYELLLHSGEKKFDKFTPYDNRHYGQVTLKYKQYIPPKHYLCTRLHGFTIQKSLVSALLKLTDTA